MAVDSHHEVFGISAVSRLTGISTHALRVWERRYGVVEPDRSNSKRREYTRDEIRRLTLLKTLVDHGHAIRNVAPLSTEQLEQRVQETTESENRLSKGKGGGETCRVAFSGAITRDALREAADGSGPIRMVGDFSEMEEMKSSLQTGSVDLIIAELPYLFPEAVCEIQKVVEKVGARRAIVIYRFAASETIGPLDKDIPNVTAMRAPVDAAELKLACLANVSMGSTPEQDSAAAIAALPKLEGDVPARKFSEQELAKIARHSSVVKCECPHHLANLLSSLGAFESYSAACESRNAEDAKLHAYLYHATAESRARMEEALEHLLVAEGIQIDD